MGQGIRGEGSGIQAQGQELIAAGCGRAGLELCGISAQAPGAGCPEVFGVEPQAQASHPTFTVLSCAQPLAAGLEAVRVVDDDAEANIRMQFWVRSAQRFEKTGLRSSLTWICALEGAHD